MNLIPLSPTLLMLSIDESRKIKTNLKNTQFDRFLLYFCRFLRFEEKFLAALAKVKNSTVRDNIFLQYKLKISV